MFSKRLGNGGGEAERSTKKLRRVLSFFLPLVSIFFSSQDAGGDDG